MSERLNERQLLDRMRQSGHPLKLLKLKTLRKTLRRLIKEGLFPPPFWTCPHCGFADNVATVEMTTLPCAQCGKDVA